MTNFLNDKGEIGIGLVILLSLIGIVVVVGMYLAGFYNNLVTLEQNVETQWSQVETQYQRRFDLIPNLTASTKGFLDQEQEIYDKITSARSQYSGASSTQEKAASATELESALGRLLVIIEDNPELKSNETVADLMTQLEGTENRISIERRRYNEEVQTYNTTIKMFPGNLIAGVMGYQEKNYFEATDEADIVPEVEL